MTAPLIELEQLAVSSNPGHKVIDIERLSVAPGEMTAVIGPNGAGKSTLLQTINLLRPWQGSLRLFGLDAATADKTALRRRCAKVFQECLLLDGTVFDNVALPLRLRGEMTDLTQRVQAVLQDFQCAHLIQRPSKALSGGERQRVNLARALITRPELLLLDEPFAALDAATQGELLEEIRQLAQQRGITVILVSHHFSDVLRFAERGIVLLEGRIRQDAPPDQLMRRPIDKMVARLAGMDNIIPCRLEQEAGGTYVQLSNGCRFAWQGNFDPKLSDCCLPGDALRILRPGQSMTGDRTAILNGVVERCIPELCMQRLIVYDGVQRLTVRVPRQEGPDDYALNQPITLTFDPRDAHLL